MWPCDPASPQEPLIGYIPQCLSVTSPLCKAPGQIPATERERGDRDNPQSLECQQKAEFVRHPGKRSLPVSGKKRSWVGKDFNRVVHLFSILTPTPQNTLDVFIVCKFLWWFLPVPQITSGSLGLLGPFPPLSLCLVPAVKSPHLIPTRVVRSDPPALVLAQWRCLATAQARRTGLWPPWGGQAESRGQAGVERPTRIARPKC